jgi:hypothetical protein
MTDNELESGQTNVSRQAPPAGLTQGTGVEQASIDAVKLQGTLETLTKRLDEIEKGYRTFQGERDKGTKDLKREVGELRSVLGDYEKLKAKGLDLDEAVEQIELKQSMAEIKQILSGSLPAKTIAGSVGGGATESARVVKDLGLDAADPEVVALLGRNLPTVELAIEAGKMLAHKATLPNPTEAQRAALKGSAPTGARSAEVVEAELVAERRIDPFSKKRKELSKELQEVGG